VVDVVGRLVAVELDPVDAAGELAAVRSVDVAKRELDSHLVYA
jgi:hypothetical protein